ncbi:MAG: hypothetical protein KDD58_13735, partial [Bdellovibrionales bacterium]|nr:hypothetical protein [Bdellovibrionales bacterium]
KNLKCEQHLDLNKLCIFSRYLDQSSIVPEKINTKAEQLGLLPCDQLKFASFDFLLNYTTLRKYNHIIQQKINLMLGELKKKAREFQPSCKEFDILPVPALYYNLELLKRDVMQLAKLQSEQRFMSMQKNIQETTDSVLYEFKASNVFPNLINHLQVGNTLISPFPYNLQLQNYFLDEMGKRGFKVISLDTLHFGHVGRGDVHCTTNTQTSCSL